MTVITRKIQIRIVNDDLDERNKQYENLHKWRFICRQAANLVSTHLFTQDNIKDYVYLTEDIKIKLADNKKEEAGVLSTSHQNTCYQTLSARFKGDIPMDVMAQLNNIIYKTYKKEQANYYNGSKSLRNYRSNIPIPFSSRLMKIDRIDEGIFFTLYQIRFQFLFGRDKSGNKTIVNRVIDQEYKLCNSSISYDKGKKKWFLLLCVDIPKFSFKPTPGKCLFAKLDLDIPILIVVGDKSTELGNKEEYLHQRNQIQAALTRLQRDLRFTSSGKSRTQKLKAISRFKKKEYNYITTKLHTYSNKLVLEAKNAKAEKIVLIDQKQSEDEAKQNPFILRNWGYFGLKEMIKYKAGKYGIGLESQNLKAHE